MSKKSKDSKKDRFAEELAEVKRLKEITTALNADDVENAFLSSATSQSEGADESTAADVLNHVINDNTATMRLSKIESSYMEERRKASKQNRARGAGKRRAKAAKRLTARRPAAKRTTKAKTKGRKR